jgi:Flagellar basal body-associated protein
MKCPKCGEELRRSKKDPHYGLCDNCRKKFKWVDNYDEDDYEEDDEYIEKKPVKRKTQSSSSARPHSRKKKKSSGVIIGIVIALIVLLVAVAIMFFFVKGRNKDKEDEPQPQNNQEEQEPSSDDTTLNEQEPPQTAPEPTDLTGTWKSEANEGAWMEATISSDSISVDWVSDGGSTRSIYWVGTYTAPTESVENYTWVSNRNAEQTDNALLASTDDTKEFTYASGKISYSVSMMGTITQMELSR